MNKKVISFSVYINLGELQNCPAFLMHKQALEKRWHLGGMEAQASNSALCDHYVFHVARAGLCCIAKAVQFVTRYTYCNSFNPNEIPSSDQYLQGCYLDWFP